MPVHGPPNRNDFPVVALGASAGGLDACRKFITALPPGNGMAFILVQHLDPSHESMMADLLATHTTMCVKQAKDEMAIEPDHFYIIPPGSYLSIQDGILRLSPPPTRHRVRLPFDFLLRTMAEAYGPRAICVVLSGTGTDGSVGLKSVKENGGLVIAQDPDDAGYDGMPRSAIATGAVDLVLAVAKIPDAIGRYDRRLGLARISQNPRDKARNWLPEIVDILRTKTTHDFTLYKQGTLQRRIERRMAMATSEVDGMGRYLEILRSDQAELELLAKDLLINVTSFFRDPEVFDLLREMIIPELVRKYTPDRPLRIWIAGCSTGEETYSLAMLFWEEMAASKIDVKLQIFASDVDSEAVATARDGLYPESIEASVSPARLARFFTKDGHHYRVSPALRSNVVFAVQNLLADPPFSRLDLISCRNLFIYLLPEAQARIVSTFHFALREAGVLILGKAETIAEDDRRFALVSKSGRFYRNVGSKRLAEPDPVNMVTQVPAPSTPGHPPAYPSTLSHLCERLVIDAFAPAAILINRKGECLHFMGPTDRYLRIAPGRPIHNLIAMARDDVRIKLRSAIQSAWKENARVVVTGGQFASDHNTPPFSISVQPVLNQGEALLLICIKDEPLPQNRQDRTLPSEEVSRVKELEQELEATRTELQGAIQNLEFSNDEQKAINEEALSVNEEFQSTNEELLTSKEELQSLNEELTSLNGQLQETLELQLTASNDLQNILYSTDLATIFLDQDLKIRFFTPATKALFRILPNDVGRPLTDLCLLATDETLMADAATVLRTLDPVERQIEAQDGAWYIRRILPYRTQNKEVQGVVITFGDITERKHIADALKTAERQAQLANSAKSRFLAAASHDLRQPLQTLALLQAQLARTAEGEREQDLVRRLDETIGTMSGMLNALLDINQIEAGTIQVNLTEFSIAIMLNKLRDEFDDHAAAQGIALNVVDCSLSIKSDPRLLEQMVRNLLSNALKYSKRGKVLLGCRRRAGKLRIEIWDTGVGIAAEELEAIFEEYYQIDNIAHERKHGLGLGLFIVKQLGALLGHSVHVRSKLDRGSVFTVEVECPLPKEDAPVEHRSRDQERIELPFHTGAILIIEDDPVVRDLLTLLLRDEGHYTAGAVDGRAALELLASGTIRPDLVIADYSLPGGMNGLLVAAKVREKLHRKIPIVILTGDISADTLRQIAHHDYIQLNKPVRPKELTQLIQRLLSKPRLSAPVSHLPKPASTGVPFALFIVDDDGSLLGAMRLLFEAEGWIVETYETCEAFLQSRNPGREGCLLIDAYLPGMSGLELLRHLRAIGRFMPAVMLTGHGDIAMAVEAMKAGAADFIEKPAVGEELLARITHVLELESDTARQAAWRLDAENHLANLTPRQQEIMKMVLAGKANKNIAADLGISQRTVENHRASIMKKTGSKSLPALARLALVAHHDGELPIQG